MECARVSWFEERQYRGILTEFEAVAHGRLVDFVEMISWNFSRSMLCYVVHGRLDRFVREGLRMTVRALFRGIETAVLSEADEHPPSNKEIKRPKKERL